MSIDIAACFYGAHLRSWPAVFWSCSRDFFDRNESEILAELRRRAGWDMCKRKGVVEFIKRG